MSQTKVQLMQPVGVMTAPGVNVSGTLTATTFDGNLVGAAGSIIGTPNVNVGIVTAVSFYGNGENLTGVAGSAFIGVVTAAQSGTTTIDLSLGNIIYFTQDTDTTVAFANSESTQVVDFIRDKDATTTARTITWPDSIIWNGGSAPTLINNSGNDVQIFKLITRDQGVTWYGYETMSNDPPIGSEPGNLYSWGRNDYGQVGNNTTQAWPGGTSSPAQLPGNQWSSTSVGRLRKFSIKSDKTLWSWGHNGFGELGLNDLMDRSSPVQVGLDETWDIVSCGYYASYGIKTDGSLWGWGWNDRGELGDGDTIDYSSPHQIPGTWSSISAGEYFASAIKTDGSLYTWGYNGYGQLGITNKIDRSSPVQLPGTWSKIDNGRYVQTAQDTDGSLWAWGVGAEGQLGQGNALQYSSPVQIPGTQWNNYVQNRDMVIADKTDGSLWVWGNNGNGQLGLNSMVQYSSPKQLPGTQWVIPDKNSYGSNMMAALTKTDGKLWILGGYNYAGSFGDNTTIDQSSPHQIPGTQWTTLSLYDLSVAARQNS
jgi:alpha-tubulin suppressor-like RCC1 family protein